MTNNELEALVEAKDFDTLHAYAVNNVSSQGEAHLEDSDGDLVTVEATSEISVEYIRRSRANDKDGNDDGVYAKRLVKGPDGEITVSDIY